MNVAVETPAVVVMVPLPLTPATAELAEHVLLEYKVKLTDPVGAAAPVELNVAVSLTGLIVVPAVPVAGAATVVIFGDAFPTEICSFESPHPVVNALLFPSPPYEAIQ